MKKTVNYILFLLIALAISATSVNAEFKKVWEHKEPINTIYIDVITKSNGHFIVVGGVYRAGYKIIEYGTSFNKVWENTIRDEPLAVTLDSDDGVVVTTVDNVLTKYDKNGNEVWFVDLEARGCDDFWSEDIIEIEDGYIVNLHCDDGYETDDDNNYLAKYAKNDGEEIWRKEFGSGHIENIFSLNSNGFLIAANNYIAKYDLDSQDEKWKKTFDDRIDGVYITNGGENIYVKNGDNLIKYDSNGTEVLNKSIDGYIQSITSNGIFTAAHTGDYDNDIYETIFIKYDLDGNKLWEKSYNFYMGLRVLSDGGYLLYFVNYNNNWEQNYIRTDSTFNQLWKLTNVENYTERMKVLSDGSYLNAIVVEETDDEYEDYFYTTTFVRYIETHKVNIGTINHGSIVSNLEEAYEGDEVELTITPDKGYELGEVIVMDALGNKIEVVDGKFIMPSTGVTINAEFIVPEVVPNPQTAVVSIIALITIIIGAFIPVYIKIKNDKRRNFS